MPIAVTGWFARFGVKEWVLPLTFQLIDGAFQVAEQRERAKAHAREIAERMQARLADISPGPDGLVRLSDEEWETLNAETRSLVQDLRDRADELSDQEDGDPEVSDEGEDGDSGEGAGEGEV